MIRYPLPYSLYRGEYYFEGDWLFLSKRGIDTPVSFYEIYLPEPEQAFLAEEKNIFGASLDIALSHIRPEVKKPLDFVNLLEAAIFHFVNQYRASRGLNKLRYHPGMHFYARQYGMRMSLGGSRAPTAEKFLRVTGKPVRDPTVLSIRNFALHALGLWLESPPHKKNILEAKYAKTAIGISTGKKNGSRLLYICQHFSEE